MSFFKKQAFTLVELIVVITILAILGTIGFVSLQGYSMNARESTRIADIGALSRMLDYHKLKNETYPLPDKSISIMSSGNLVGYQGYLAQNVFTTIGFSSKGTDPLDNSYYGYYVLANKAHMQVGAAMEKGSYTLLNKNEVYAAPNRFSKVVGNKLGILTDTNNVPLDTSTGVTSIDIIQTTQNYIAHISDDISYQGTGSQLRYAVPLSSCQRLADINIGGPSGYYMIYPISNIPVEVYCDFSNEGEGLTLIARSVNNATFNGSPFGWFVSRGSPKNNTQPYSLGNTVRDIPFQKVYLTVYDIEKHITGTTTLDVTDIELFNGAYANTSLPVDGCVGADIGGGNTSCTLFNRWGKFNSTTSYWFSNNPTNTTDGLNARRYGTTFPYPGMIFVK